MFNILVCLHMWDWKLGSFSECGDQISVTFHLGVDTCKDVLLVKDIWYFTVWHDSSLEFCKIRDTCLNTHKNREAYSTDQKAHRLCLHFSARELFFQHSVRPYSWLDFYSFISLLLLFVTDIIITGFRVLNKQLFAPSHSHFPSPAVYWVFRGIMINYV